MSIEIKGLTFNYGKKTSLAHRALDNVNLSIGDGEFVAVIGNTGSGKSTLLQHLNGLAKKQEGELIVEGINLSERRPNLLKLRASVGMVFQYPEYQLFEDTVQKDVAFGPKNFGFKEEEIPALVREAVEMTGLDFESVKDCSPFELSRGQMRRVAIAGVIASKPSVLVLDEPTSGLDPVGRQEILELVAKLKREYVKTVIMVSHNMDEVAKYADRVIVLHDGKIVYDLPPRALFAKGDEVRALDLDIPHAEQIAADFRQKGFDMPVCLTEDELIAALNNALGGENV